MSTVLVALITATAAVVPQVLVWLQNRRRDQWEQHRQVALDLVEQQRADSTARAEELSRLHGAFNECLTTVGEFLAVAFQSWTPEARRTHAEMVTAWTAALTVADAKTAFVLDAMLTEHNEPTIHFVKSPEELIPGLLRHRSGLAHILAPVIDARQPVRIQVSGTTPPSDAHETTA